MTIVDGAREMGNGYLCTCTSPFLCGSTTYVRNILLIYGLDGRTIAKLNILSKFEQVYTIRFCASLATWPFVGVEYRRRHRRQSSAVVIHVAVSVVVAIIVSQSPSYSVRTKLPFKC